LVWLIVSRFRRRLLPDERRLGFFALGLALMAFLLALSPQGIRVYDTDLGPVQLVARVVPRFRVPNRTAIVVHFAALLGAGVVATRLLSRRLSRGGPKAALAGFGLSAVVVLDYPPHYGVELAPVTPQRADLEASAGDAPCGSGMTVPYATWGGHDSDYYKVYTSLRGTSCKLLHTSYLTDEDEILRVALGKDAYSDSDRVVAEQLASCTGASWVLFRPEASALVREAFCAEMGWFLWSPDICRAPGSAPRAVRSMRACVAELGLPAPAPP
jgi:hypothetical protein